MSKKYKTYEKLIQEVYVSHIDGDAETRALKRRAVERELAQQIGMTCLRKGLIHYSYKVNDWTSPTYIEYDKVTASITVDKETDELITSEEDKRIIKQLQRDCIIICILGFVFLFILGYIAYTTIK